MKMLSLRGVVLVAAALWAPLAAAQTRLVPAGSEIVFISKQMGVPVEGRFKRFDAQVELDPKKPEAGKVALRVDLGSVAFGAPEVEAEVAKAEWFHTARFPQATFASTGIKAAGPRRYEVAGTLTLKGVARSVVVPVTLAPAGADTQATGSFTLKRLEYKIGDGDWNDPSLVGDAVEVRFKLVLAGLPAP